MKVTEELEKIILELRLNSRFGPRRIKFRSKRKYEVSLGTKTIYNILETQAHCTVSQTKKKIQTI